MTTSPAVLTTVLAAGERPDPAFDAAAVGDWPAGALDGLVTLGLLAAADPAAAVACDACGFDHVEPVQWVGGPGTARRAFISCPAVGAVRLDPADLRRWVVRLPVLVRLVAGAVGTAGAVVERVPGRVWKLGTVRVAGRAWVGFLAVGLARPDGAAVVEGVPELRAANALVFVPSAVPAEAVWAADRAPTVVPLCDLLTAGPTGLVADREALASALAPAARSLPKDAARTFPTPPGTAWEQVALVVEEHHLRVRVGDAAARFGFADAGFADGRAAGAPDGQWALLAVLARQRGTLGTDDAVATKSPVLKQRVGVLRARLRALLGIDGDPFHHTGKGRPYRARFAIRSDGPPAFPTPPGTTWDDLTLTETRTGIDIAVAAETRGLSRAGKGAWEGTVERGERRSAHTLADLGLADAGGGPTPAGAALVALLRAGGRLARPISDPDLFALGDALARFFQLDTPPLAFDRNRGVWAARFDATSQIAADGQN